jgi:hypothetical protein
VIGYLFDKAHAAALPAIPVPITATRIPSPRLI